MPEEKCHCAAFRVIAREQGWFPLNVESDIFHEKMEEFIFISSIEKQDV